MEPEKKSDGALVGLIIIVIILIIGGIYIWQSKTARAPIQSETAAPNDENLVELNSLEADLETIDTDTGVDANAVY